MAGQDIKITAQQGGAFDCYLSLPARGPAPAVVIMPSVFGVDGDVRANCDDLAARGFVAAAPDPFWRGDAGPMGRDEDGARRARERALDRAPLIEQGVTDLADVLAELKRLPECNGKVAVVGLCYGGPYAILGPARLGCDAGIAFHGTVLENYLDDLSGVHVPLSLHWGDQDHACPPETLARIREATGGMADVDITIYPGVGHGYSAPSSVKAWDEKAAENSWRRAVEVLDGLRTPAEAASA
jgi:carboxymethylenebutenolidase